MANIDHSTMTDPYLHEPKGIAAATRRKVYVSNGSASGSWTELNRGVGGFITFSTSTPYAHAATTSDSALNPSFSLVANNGFTGEDTPNARLKYTGTETITCNLDGIFSIQQASGSKVQVELVLYKNGVELIGSRTITTANSGDWATAPLMFNTTLSTNDYIEVKVRTNTIATVNFASGYLRISGVAA